MTKLTLFFICLISASYAQDSLFVGKSFTLAEVRYPICTRWGEDWAEREFDEEYAPVFDSIAQFLRANSSVKFDIRCYTDSRGSDSANMILSQNRANSWFSRLVSRGVDSSQIRAIGYGESTPVTIWMKDSTYYKDQPKNVEARPVVLTEPYINSFRETDKKRFEMLHQFNRREELVVTSIEE